MEITIIVVIVVALACSCRVLRATLLNLPVCVKVTLLGEKLFLGLTRTSVVLFSWSAVGRQVPFLGDRVGV